MQKLLFPSFNSFATFIDYRLDDVEKYIYDTILEHGGTANTMDLSLENFRSTYLKRGTDFPLVPIPGG